MRVSELKAKRLIADNLSGHGDNTVTVKSPVTFEEASTFSGAVAVGGSAGVTGAFNLGKTELTASGAIDPSATSFVGLNHASTPIAATIAAPVLGQFLVISDTSASGTAAHTVTLTAGTFDGTNNIATFNAPGETLVLFGVSATRYVIVENIGTVGLST